MVDTAATMNDTGSSMTDPVSVLLHLASTMVGLGALLTQGLLHIGATMVDQGSTTTGQAMIDKDWLTLDH